MASDDDIIYVDVAARLDEKTAEQATGKLRDKFKGVGKTISDVVGSEFGQEFTREISNTFGSRLEELGKEVGEKLGSAIGSGVKDLASDFGVDLSGLEGTVQRVTDALGSFKQGDAAQGLSGVAKALTDIAGDNDASKVLQDVSDKAAPLQVQFEGLKGDIRGTVDDLKGLVSDSPAVVAALGAISEAAAPLAAALLALEGGWIGLNKLRDNIYGAGTPAPPGVDPKKWDEFTHGKPMSTDELLPTTQEPNPGGLGDLLGAPPPTAPPTGAPAAPRGPVTGPPSAPGAPAPGWSSGGQTLLPSAPTAPGDLGGLLGGTGTAGFSAGGDNHVTLVDSTTSVTGPSDIPAAGAGVANLYRVAQALQGTPYSQQLRNDCSGMVSKLANAALGLPLEASFSTQNEGQWLAGHGFQEGMGGPNDMSVGWYNHGSDPNAGHTAATLPGGVNAEAGGSHGAFALGSGSAGAGSPQFDHHMHLPMAGGAGGGFSAAPAGFGPPGGGGLPPGLGPLMPPTQPSSSGGGPGGGGGPITQQPIGKGSGVGVSGGGIIGAAEQAGVMAAAIGGFGGGGIAAQAAMQEMNLAVQKTGQMGAALVSAPLETLGLTGGQMGAPTVNPMGGWPGKILGGLIGQQTNLPNIAGATQKPKQPGDKDPKGDDPGNGGQSGGPSGAKDDPIHTKSTDPAPQAPQGAATSAGNMTGVMSAIPA